MARGAEARAAMVAGADLRLAGNIHVSAALRFPWRHHAGQATPSHASNYRLVPVNEFRKATSACFSSSVNSIGLTRSLLLGL